MSKVMDDMSKVVIYKEAVRGAKRILETGKCIYEEIAECVELPVDEIKALAREVGERKCSPTI